MNEKNIKHTLNITLFQDGTCELRFHNIPFPELVRLALMTIQVAGERTLNTAPADLKGALESDMHELINLGASTLLQKLCPNVSLRPDLTVDAILKAENELLNSPEKVSKATEAYVASADFVKDIAERKAGMAKVATMEAHQKDQLGITDHKKKSRPKKK